MQSGISTCLKYRQVYEISFSQHQKIDVFLQQQQHSITECLKCELKIRLSNALQQVQGVFIFHLITTIAQRNACIFVAQWES